MSLIAAERGRPLAAMLLPLLFLAGCVNGDDDRDNTARDAVIYRVVIADLVERSAVEFDGTEEVPVVFIEAFGADGIPLQVQVEVVAGFIEQYEIRFIDERDEAIEVGVPGSTVEFGGVLIGLDPIIGDDTADVHAEIYVSSDEITAYDYTMVPGGEDGWSVVGDPRSVAPEGFVLPT